MRSGDVRLVVQKKQQGRKREVDGKRTINKRQNEKQQFLATWSPTRDGGGGVLAVFG